MVFRGCPCGPVAAGEPAPARPTRAKKKAGKTKRASRVAAAGPGRPEREEARSKPADAPPDAPASAAAPLVLRRRLRQGFAVAHDGSAIWFQVREPGAGSDEVPIVCSDGIGCDGYVWKYLEPELSRERAVIRWHYRGHGKTPLPRDPERVAIADSADDLAAVLDAAGYDRAILAGHSMGVQVSLEAWRRARSRVAGLVLVCGSYGNPLRTFKGKRTLEDALPLARFAIHRVPRLVTAFWRSVLPTDFAYRIATLTEINRELIRREDFFPYLEHMASVDVRLFVDMLAAAGRHSARELLPAIDVPTLIVAGDRDSFTPTSLSEEMHAAIPDSELMIVRGGSHTTPIERPGEVNERVTAFLRRVQ